MTVGVRAQLLWLCSVAAVAIGAAAPLVPTDLPTRLAALLADALPRGVVTVAVAVPDELQSARSVSFTVQVTGDVEVLGRRNGVARAAGAESRPVVLTLRVPAGAEAGERNAAEVHFRGDNGDVFIVPVIIRVALVRSIELVGPREMRGLRIGNRLELVYRVLNSGNAADTLVISARGPLGWNIRTMVPARIIVPSRGQFEVPVRVEVAGTANVGDHDLVVRVRAPRDVDLLGEVHTTLGVSGRADQALGLVLRPTVAIAASNAGSGVFTGAQLEGNVRPGVFLRMQATPNASNGGLVTQGLSSVGAMITPFSAYLYGERWDVAAGNIGLQLSDLTGVNVMGRGISGRSTGDRYSTRAILAQPNAGRSNGGVLAGAGVWKNMSAGRVGVSASHFEERNLSSTGRELTALGFDYASLPIGTMTFGAGLALRHSTTTSGLGYALSATHERDNERGGLRLTHAPGGTGAFARATNELQADYARSFTERWSGDITTIYSRDESPFYREMRVSSWSLGQRYLWTPTLQFTLRGAASQFDARTAAGGIGDFGAADRTITAGAEWRQDLVTYSAEAGTGVLGRSSQRFDGRMSTTVASTHRARVGMARPIERLGVLDVSAGMEFTEAGIGLPEQMLNASVRWNAIPLHALGREWRLSSEASYQRFGGVQAAFVTRSSVSVALPWGLDLALSAERNPFFRDARGRAGWVAAMRVSASTRVTTIEDLGPTGIVFRDTNQNGVRDAGEAGVAGVVVRRGEARARTSAAGEYRLPVNARGATRVQQSTLPLGLVAHPLLAADSLERLDLPMLPTATVEVTLELAPDDEGRAVEMDLEPVTVMLRDATGFVWVGRKSGDARAVFSGIPVGVYTVELNTARLREPLRISTLPRLDLAPDVTERVVVTLQRRAIRIFTPQRSRSSASTGAAAVRP